MHERWWLHCISQRGGRCCWVSMCTEWLSHSKWVEQRIYVKFCVRLENSFSEKYSDDSEGCSYGQLVIGCFITTMCPLTHHVSCRIFDETVNYPGDSAYSPDLAPCDFGLFPKLKSPFKGKRFQSMDEIQENRTGELMAIGRTVWDFNVPTLKGTEASLSCVKLECTGTWRT